MTTGKTTTLTRQIFVNEVMAQVPSLGWEDPLKEGRATHSSILAWRKNPIDRGAWWATVHGGAKELDTTEET